MWWFSMSLGCTCIRNNRSGCGKAFLDVTATPPTMCPYEAFSKVGDYVTCVIGTMMCTVGSCHPDFSTKIFGPVLRSVRNRPQYMAIWK